MISAARPRRSSSGRAIASSKGFRGARVIAVPEPVTPRRQDGWR
jgi:hypothetical protein